MKLWILTSEYPEEFQGGIARYVQTISEVLKERGVDLTVITRSKTSYHRRVADRFSVIGLAASHNKFVFHSLADLLKRSPVLPSRLLAYWPVLSYQMANLVEELIRHLGAPDVIECQEYGALPYFLLQRKLVGNGVLAGIPIVVHCHSPSYLIAEANHQPVARFPGYWVGEMEKFCISAADALLCPSHFLADEIAHQIPCREKIEVIPLPYTPHSDVEAIAASSSSCRTVLYFGRLEVRKGILDAIESVERLWNMGEDFRIVLIGGDTECAPRGTTVGGFIRSRYAHQIESGQLRILDSCGWEELQKYILSAQVVIVPSLWENFPNTCMEAMSLGRVVLASIQGGQAELIGSDGENGVLFDWNIPGDFAAKLSHLLKLSSSERERMGERARVRVEEYCCREKIATQRLEHFERIIKRHAKPAFFPAPWLSYRLPVSLQECSSVLAPRKEESQLSQNEKEPFCRLSLIIPYYNLGKYVKSAVESALKSTTAPNEILIVDDCSTGEENLSVLQELENQYPSVRVIRHAFNRGLAVARNTGAKEARGEFLAFLDADDEVKPEFFEKALPVLETYPNVGFVYSWVQFFENSQTIWPTWNAHFPYLLGHNMLVPICLVRKEAFLEVGGNKPQFRYNFEDYECWINLLKHGWLGVSLPECLTRYRVRKGSMLRSATEDQFRYLYDLLVRTHPELYREWGGQLAQLQAANGSAIRWDHPARNYWERQVGASVIGWIYKLASWRSFLKFLR